MKKTFLTLAGILVAIATFATGNGDSNTLTVTIKNFKNTTGNASVTLFDSEVNFLSTGTKQILDIEDAGTLKVVFNNIKAGIYAVAIVHDENDNGELDKGTFGIPIEDYAFSNNAKGMFGPPSFEETKFEISGDKAIEISIN